jgi:Rod binding domain-containing protein
MDETSGVPRSSLDFQGLGELKARAQGRDEAATRQTAQQFEAMFIQMMLKSMRDAVPKSDLLQSKSMDTFEAMYDREIAVALSKKGGLGLADMMMKHLSHPKIAAKDYLQDRQSMQKTIQLEKVQKSYDLIRDASDKGIPLDMNKEKSFPVNELRNRSFSIRKLDANQNNDDSKKHTP